MKLRSRLAITCAKGTSALIKKLNRGSGVTLPGYVARLIDPNILSVMASQIREKTIVTMGTNGKTTTNAILYKALKAEGKTVIINRTGANMLNGIISAFVLATDKHGQLNADYACIEVDEIASVGVLPQLKPDCALLTNISRDQLDRFGEVDITFDKLKTAVTSVPDTTLIINCDAPRCVWMQSFPKAGCAGSILNLLDMKEFNHQVELTTGVLEEQCSGMMKQFFKELRQKQKDKKKKSE